MSDVRLGPGQSDSIAKIAAALVRARRQFGPALKTAYNPHFKSKFVDLAGVMEAVDGALMAEGISVVQFPQQRDEHDEIVTMLVHESGEYMRGGGYAIEPVKGSDPQAKGSAVTYARRYSLMAMLGIAPEDDDGSRGSGRGVFPSDPSQERPRGNPNPKQHPAVKAAAEKFNAAPKEEPAHVSSLLLVAELKGVTEARVLTTARKDYGALVLADLTPEQARTLELKLQKLPDAPLPQQQGEASP